MLGKKLSLAAALLGLTIISMAPARLSLAQQPTPNAASLAAASDLLTALGSEKQFEIVIPMMLQQMRAVIVKANPAVAKDIDEAMTALAVKFQARKSEVIPLMAEVYARRLSIADMQAMTAFFKTPAGARFVQTMPQLTQEGMAVGQQWGMKIGQEVDRELRQELSKRGIKL